MFLLTLTMMIGSKSHVRIRPIGMQMEAATPAPKIMPIGLITRGPSGSIGIPVTLSVGSGGGAGNKSRSMMSSKAKPLTRIITVWARVKPGTPRVVMPAQSEWLNMHARNRRFHTLSTSLCQRLVSSVVFVLALASFQRCRPVGLAPPPKAARTEAVAAEGAAAGSTAEAGEGSPSAPAPTTDPAALVGAKARAAMALADSFDGVATPTGSKRDMFSVEPSEGAGEEVRSSVMRGIRDVTN